MNETTNIKFGWLWILLGIISGALLGTFAFNGPIQFSPELMDYNSLPRRMLRLAHISFIGLGFLNWMYGVTVNSLKIKIRKNLSVMFIFGAVTMPLFLIVSAFYEPFKYSLVIPATTLLIATVIFYKSLYKKDCN